jgi:hypothetical protein
VSVCAVGHGVALSLSQKLHEEQAMALLFLRNSHRKGNRHNPSENVVNLPPSSRGEAKSLVRCALHDSCTPLWTCSMGNAAAMETGT